MEPRAMGHQGIRLYPSHRRFYVSDSEPLCSSGEPDFRTRQSCDDHCQGGQECSSGGRLPPNEGHALEASTRASRAAGTVLTVEPGPTTTRVSRGSESLERRKVAFAMTRILPPLALAGSLLAGLSVSFASAQTPGRAGAYPGADLFQRGWKYDQGLGTPINIPKAMRCYREAA